jgi:hypothetical protein
MREEKQGAWAIDEPRFVMYKLSWPRPGTAVPDRTDGETVSDLQRRSETVDQTAVPAIPARSIFRTPGQ